MPKDTSDITALKQEALALKERDLNEKIKLNQENLRLKEEELQRRITQGQDTLAVREAIANQQLALRQLQYELNNRKAEDAQSKEEYKELTDIRHRFEGKVKDSQGNKLGYNQEHINRFNELSKTEFAFEHSEPGFGNLWTNKSVKVVPNTEIDKMYKFFISQGGQGSFEQFKQNPQVLSTVFNDMRKTK